VVKLSANLIDFQKARLGHIRNSRLFEHGAPKHGDVI